MQLFNAYILSKSLREVIENSTCIDKYPLHISRWQDVRWIFFSKSCLNSCKHCIMITSSCTSSMYERVNVCVCACVRKTVSFSLSLQ